MTAARSHLPTLDGSQEDDDGDDDFYDYFVKVSNVNGEIKENNGYAAVKSFLTDLMQSSFISKGHHQRRMVIGKIDNDIGDNDEQAIL